MDVDVSECQSPTQIIAEVLRNSQGHIDRRELAGLLRANAGLDSPRVRALVDAGDDVSFSEDNDDSLETPAGKAEELVFPASPALSFADEGPTSPVSKLRFAAAVSDSEGSSSEDERETPPP